MTMSVSDNETQVLLRSIGRKLDLISDELFGLKRLIVPIKTRPDLTEQKLRDLMRDPKYWRDHDPETVKKIEQGFERLYGKK